MTSVDLESEERSRTGKILVIAVACYMGFSAGASNVANAVAPLVGAGVVPLIPAVIFGGLAIGLGWGRETRRVTIQKELSLEDLTEADCRHIEEDTEQLFKRSLIGQRSAGSDIKQRFSVQP